MPQNVVYFILSLLCVFQIIIIIIIIIKTNSLFTLFSHLSQLTNTF